jgi:pimeloyl-ACP methyl ester carboxylesterase
MKQTLIILPGWGGSHETWQKFIDLAKKDYNTYCIDLPCFGTEPCPKEVWGVEDYSKFVKEKVDKIKKQNKDSEIILLGHSFGGQVATYFVANNQDMIDRFILSGAAIFRAKRKITRIMFKTVAKFGKIIFKLPYIEKFDVFAKKLLYKAADSPDYAKTSGIKREIFKKIIRQDFGHLLPSIKQPTLIVWGKFDKYVPVSDGEKMAKLIPNAKLHVFKNGTHGLHLLKPEKLLEVINKFSKK